MTVYAVFKEAVYRHECGGIFTTTEAAEKAAVTILDAEDGHHEVHIVPFEVDQQPVMERAAYDWVRVDEPQTLLRMWKVGVQAEGSAEIRVSKGAKLGWRPYTPPAL